MNQDHAVTEEPLAPPANGAIRRGTWAALPDDDPLVQFIVAHYWDHPEAPQGWQVARMSAAAHVLRESATRWAIVAKFYVEKTGKDAARYAQREHEVTLQARAAGLAAGDMRALCPLVVWRGVLLLEYIDGLTLEDTIAVRRHRPGELIPALEGAARLLATLHRAGAQPDAQPDFARDAEYARKMVEQLARWGVLEGNATVVNGLYRLIDRWEQHATLSAYTPALTHGDATTTNFVYPWTGGIVAIDWERAKVTDPAADMGRLIAEMAHSTVRHGGSMGEVQPLIAMLLDAYCERTACEGGAREQFTQRVTFFRAVSTLRIARNGWVSRLDRTAMVAEALALLADCPAC